MNEEHFKNFSVGMESFGLFYVVLATSRMLGTVLANDGASVHARSKIGYTEVANLKYMHPSEKSGLQLQCAPDHVPV